MLKPILMKDGINYTVKIELLINFEVVDTFMHDFGPDSHHMNEYIKLANKRNIPYQMIRIDNGRSVIVHNGKDVIWYTIGFENEVQYVNFFNIKEEENGKEQVDNCRK